MLIEKVIEMKKVVSLILCLTILFSCFSFSVFAEDEKTTVPAFINFFEKHGTNLVSLLGRFWNTIVETDETDIPSATEFSPSYKEYTGETTIIPEQTLTAETWVANEISFTSEKTYENPFEDVDVKSNEFKQIIQNVPYTADGTVVKAFVLNNMNDITPVKTIR